MATTKARKPKAEPKLTKTAPVVQCKIPARYLWGETPLEAASIQTSETLGKLATDHTLEATTIGDFIAVRNEDCDETFVIHVDVLKELIEAAS